MKAVRFSKDDLAIVEAAKQKLGCRSASEVLRMGLRSLAREQGLAVPESTKPESTKPKNP